jgi:hypothetical protein
MRQVKLEGFIALRAQKVLRNILGPRSKPFQGLARSKQFTKSRELSIGYGHLLTIRLVMCGGREVG